MRKLLTEVTQQKKLNSVMRFSKSKLRLQEKHKLLLKPSEDTLELLGVTLIMLCFLIIGGIPEIRKHTSSIRLIFLKNLKLLLIETTKIIIVILEILKPREMNSDAMYWISKMTISI